MKQKWTHYVHNKHFLDSGRIEDLGKEEILIKNNEIKPILTTLGVTLINGKKRMYLRMKWE